MITFEWRTFTPAGGDFIAQTEGGHVLAGFTTGEDAWAGAIESNQPRHAQCYRASSLVGFIDEINVRKQYRRKGVGSALLVDTLNKFKEIGVHTVYLRARPERPEWLVDLLRFYWRYGFDIAKDCIDVADTMLTLKATLD
jgi:ribosomal protein S18 acetylase RimI-like enzyme